MTLRAPWTAEQIAGLNRFQVRRDFHPFTCGRDSRHAVLVATEDGWVCPDCPYRQDWAHSCMVQLADYVRGRKLQEVE